VIDGGFAVPTRAVVVGMHPTRPSEDGSVRQRPFENRCRAYECTAERLVVGNPGATELFLSTFPVSG